MSKKKRPGQKIVIPNQTKSSATAQNPQSPVVSLLDFMEEGKEYESLLKLKTVNLDLISEVRRALKDISEIRQRPNIVYVANVVNPNIKSSRAIDYSDDLPFSELVNTVDPSSKEVDIILVTPGGSGTQVAKFVDKLRPRFEDVCFILPNIAMSAGTIFAMSGNDIIMTNVSYIGPVDPQVPNKDGMYVPAQAILTLIEEIKEKGDIAIKKGTNPDWTDLQILRQIDPKEIGTAINGSKYSVQLVENYLHDFKFKNWLKHKDGRPVTAEEKKNRASEIANQLCKHSLWKTHDHGISREIAWAVCKLQITHSESIPGLDRAIKRLWALLCWIFENTQVFKTFVSENYSFLRNDRSLIVQK